ncbi:MAG TPA: ferrochelatase [Caulifigura sp.]|nr:ferrochelatase [Caulifigura sp.]
MSYDSLLVVSFGGPEGPDDVIPFLENVLRGRNVPRERMLEVAQHYQRFGGISPINAQNRALIAALRSELDAHGIDLPIYFGNRNWHPLLADTLEEMSRDGRTHTLAFVTSGQSSYSGCRQYRENILAAQQHVGESAPAVDKLRVFYNHPDYIAAEADRILAELAKFSPADREEVHLLCTAHSIPNSMAGRCDYVKQLTETTWLLAEILGVPAERVQLVYQSRSGRPEDPWLEPDVKDAMTALHQKGVNNLVIAPIGFLSDHIEIMFDLDEECVQLAQELGITMHRAGTVGTHPRFITMIRKLIQERLDPQTPREAIGRFGPNWDVCPVDCCPAPQRPGRPAT